MENKDLSEKSIIKQKKRLLKKDDIILIIIVCAIVIIDQVCKIIVVNNGDFVVIAGVLQFTINHNTDAAYGIGSNSTFMYVITNVIILGVIFKFINMQNQYIDMKYKVFLGFIFAGGLSNVIDRIFRGFVVEFIDLTNLINIPIFNLADLFVITGWVVVAAIFASFTAKEYKNSKLKNKKGEK